MHTFAMFRTLMLEGATVVMVAVRPLISCSAWVVPNGLHAAHRLHYMCIYDTGLRNVIVLSSSGASASCCPACG